MAINITIPHKEIMHIDTIDEMPTNGGIYLFYNESCDELLYIGKSGNMKQRIRMHLSSDKNTVGIRHNFKWVEYFYVDCPMERDIYETYLINTLEPSLNVNKVFTYNTSRWDGEYKSEEQIRKEEIEQEEINKIISNLNL